MDIHTLMIKFKKGTMLNNPTNYSHRNQVNKEDHLFDDLN